MGIFNNVTTLGDFILGRRRGITDGANSQIGAVYTTQTNRTRSGETVTVDNLMEDATVIAGVNAIAKGISQIPLLVQRTNEDGSKEMDRNNPLYQLIKRPNVYQTSSEFKSCIVTNMIVHGNAFIRIIRVDGVPKQLVPLDPQDITIGVTLGGLPAYNHSSFGDIDMEDMVHVRDVVTYTPQGYSRLLLAAERIGALKAADKLMASTFKNGISVNYVVEAPGVIAKEAMDTFAESLEARFSAQGENRANTLILSEGASMNQIKGATPADADLRELRQDLIREIAAVLGVPAYMLGTNGDEKYNNVRQKTAAFTRDTLSPLMVVIQEAFTLRLTDDPNLSFYFDDINFVKGAVNEQAQVASQLLSSGVLTPNEAREFMGYNPSDDEGADMLVTPNSTVSDTTTTTTEEQPTGGEDGPNSRENRERGDDDG